VVAVNHRVQEVEPDESGCTGDEDSHDRSPASS
jgi:hypothetical protein